MEVLKGISHLIYVDKQIREAVARSTIILRTRGEPIARPYSIDLASPPSLVESLQRNHRLPRSSSLYGDRRPGKVKRKALTAHMRGQN